MVQHILSLQQYTPELVKHFIKNISEVPNNRKDCLGALEFSDVWTEKKVQEH